MRGTCKNHRIYTRGCPDCPIQSARYRRYRLAKLRDGTWDHPIGGTQLEAVRQHLKLLLAISRVSVPLIADVAGVSYKTIYRVIRKPDTRLGTHIVESLLRVTPQACIAYADSHRDVVPSIGVQRRLQALAADGWDGKTLADLCGVGFQRLSHLRTGTYPTVTRRTHNQICDLYEKIQSQADPSGPSLVAARMARHSGFLLPERWADEDLDNPNAQPLPPPPETEDHVAVTKIIEDCLHDPQPGKAADLPLPVKRELARHAHNRLGWSWERLAWLFGYQGASSAQYLVDGRPGRVPKTQIKRTRK